MTDLPAELISNKDLAYEVVLQFFDDAQLCLRYGITPATLTALRASEPFKREMLEAKKRIAKEGELFRMQAQEYANQVLADLYSIAQGGEYVDKDGKLKTITLAQRMQAMEMLARYAGYDNAKDAAATVGLQIHLATNLNMQPMSTDGKYTIEAKAERVTLEDLV